MGKTITVDVEHDATVSTAIEAETIDKAMDIESELIDKLADKIKENKGIDADITVSLESFGEEEENMAMYNITIQFETEATVEFGSPSHSYYEEPEGDIVDTDEFIYRDIIDDAIKDLGYESDSDTLEINTDTENRIYEKAMNLNESYDELEL